MTSFFSPDRRDLRDSLRGERTSAAGLARRARFSRWDGSQQIPDLAAEEILDALADDVMAEGDVGEALRRLMDRGWHSGDTTRPDLAGLQDLLERLRERRREITARHRLGDVFADVRRELDEIVDTERVGIERRLDEAARDAPGDAAPGEQAALRRMLRETAAKRLERLEALPRDVGARIRGLQDYDFLEPAARQRFAELVQRLRSTVLDRYVQGMSEALRSMTPESLGATREMVRDLNQLLQERLAGGDPDASAFLSKWGSYFPGARTLDDVIEQLADRMAAMQ